VRATVTMRKAGKFVNGQNTHAMNSGEHAHAHAHTRQEKERTEDGDKLQRSQDTHGAAREAISGLKREGFHVHTHK